MNDPQQLISEIDSFLAETGMAPSTFGQKAVSNWRIVDQIKSGGNTGINTIARIREFMREHKTGVRAA